MPTNTNMLTEEKFNIKAFEKDVKKALDRNNWTMAYLNEEVLARGYTYMSNCFGKKRIPLRVVMTVCNVLGLKLADYEIKPEPPKPVVKEELPSTVAFPAIACKGWENTLSVNVSAGIVSLAFFKDGQKVASGRAKIFDNTDHGIMQAISYAAHMCYKFSEQRELFVQNQSNTVGGVCKITNNTGNTSTYRR